MDDTIAVLEHENEKWSLDYNLLSEKNDKIQSELNVLKNIESGLASIN